MEDFEWNRTLLLFAVILISAIKWGIDKFKEKNQDHYGIRPGVGRGRLLWAPCPTPGNSQPQERAKTLLRSPRSRNRQRDQPARTATPPSRLSPPGAAALRNTDSQYVQSSLTRDRSLGCRKKCSRKHPFGQDRWPQNPAFENQDTAPPEISRLHPPGSHPQRGTRHPESPETRGVNVAVAPCSCVCPYQIRLKLLRDYGRATELFRRFLSSFPSRV